MILSAQSEKAMVLRTWKVSFNTSSRRCRKYFFFPWMGSGCISRNRILCRGIQGLVQRARLVLCSVIQGQLQDRDTRGKRLSKDGKEGKTIFLGSILKWAAGKAKKIKYYFLRFPLKMCLHVCSTIRIHKYYFFKCPQNILYMKQTLNWFKEKFEI